MTPHLQAAEEAAAAEAQAKVGQPRTLSGVSQLERFHQASYKLVELEFCAG